MVRWLRYPGFFGEFTISAQEMANKQESKSGMFSLR